MFDDDFYDDPSYRAGVLMGRRQSVNDILERLAASPDTKAVVATVTEWCDQTEQELDVELLLLIRDQQRQTDGTG